ncbi:serine hydrolase [Haloglycomyces albus]|uniref:serine hydrolase n=1 Tax=Haloglycomyces albus TaxID=526067 RepID=UPI00046D6E54|nr:serine hydrolase [Haloglycomyces albus]
MTFPLVPRYRFIVVSLVLVMALLLSSSDVPGGPQVEVPPHGLGAEEVSGLEGGFNAEATEAYRDFARVVNDSVGDWGVAVYDRRDSEAVVKRGHDRSFRMQSVVKILIALEALSVGVSESDVSEMLSTSHDHEASRMWYEAGSDEIVRRWADSLELHDTRPPDDPMWWGHTETTASDLVTLLRFLVGDGFDDHHGEVIVRAMRDTTRTGEDGFDQYFGVPVGMADLGWAVKQGWACCSDSYRALNSVGFVGPDHRFVVVIQARWPEESLDWDEGRAEIDSVATHLGRLLEAIA